MLMKIERSMTEYWAGGGGGWRKGGGESLADQRIEPAQDQLMDPWATR